MTERKRRETDRMRDKKKERETEKEETERKKIERERREGGEGGREEPTEKHSVIETERRTQRKR